MNDDVWITRRIIDTFLRENIRDIVSKGVLIPSSTTLFSLGWLDKKQHEETPIWLLKISHLSQVFYLPVIEHGSIQRLKAVGNSWFYRSDQWSSASGYKQWLALMAEGLPVSLQHLFEQFIDEVNCAIEQKSLCEKAYHNYIDKLRVFESECPYQSLVLSDQIASYTDHPLYPTARAKFGLDKESLCTYAPEFANTFTLRWVWVDGATSYQFENPPTFWPTAKQLGLKPTGKGVLLPVHPTMLNSLANRQGVTIAPKAYLDVKATLSVRTVAVMEDLRFHIKLPMPISTLGRLNKRLIKPHSLDDGALMTEALTTLLSTDEKLADCMICCDETSYGYKHNDNELAYLVREYPPFIAGQHLISKAAFFTPMKDGRYLIQHAIDHHYNKDKNRWFDDFINTILTPHLRLWLVYGIAIEANQQNTLLCFDTAHMTLVLKDIDTPRVLLSRYQASGSVPESNVCRMNTIKDKRIFVENDEKLAQLFITMIFHLTLFPVVENLFDRSEHVALYKKIVDKIETIFVALGAEGVACDYARTALINTPLHPVKYLLTATTLMPKSPTSSVDVNKFYGETGVNPLFEATKKIA